MRDGRGQRGSIFVLSAFMVMLVTAWMSSGLGQSSTEHQAARLSLDSSRAFHLAEAGLEQAIQNLQTISGTDDVYAGTLPTGTFTIDQPLTILSVLLYEAHTHGTSRNVQRSLDAVLRVTPLSIFRFAMFGDKGVTVGGSARVDSYDSRNGPYNVPTNVGVHGDVGTNATDYGAIDLNGSQLFINGQLSVGPGVAQPNSIVDGFNASLISANPPVVSRPTFPLPEVKIPQGLACQDLALQGSVVWTLPSPGPYCFTNLSVTGGATLTSNGPVTIYLVNSLQFEGNSTIGVVNDPTKTLFLMASGSSVTIQGAIEGNANMYAAMYGPDAHIAIDGHAAIYGSIVGNKVGMAGDSALHYDEALAHVNNLSNEGKVDLLCWREGS